MVPVLNYRQIGYLRVSSRILPITLLCLILGAAAVWAYTSSARNSLLKSRDQVADQQFQLKKASDEISGKINELQKQKYNIDRYIADCDRTLREIDRALNVQDDAYRGR